MDFDHVMRDLEAQQQRVEEVRRSIEQMELTGRSRNNEVVAKLRGTGQFTQILIDPRALQRYDHQSIGMLVTEAVNDGLGKVGKAHQEKFAPLIEEAQR